MIVYKLFHRRKDGTLGSLFINCKERIPLNTWMTAKPYRTVGYAYRPGWHCLPECNAPHLKMNINRVWCKVQVKDIEIHTRPIQQGGNWILAKQMKVLEVL